MRVNATVSQLYKYRSRSSIERKRREADGEGRNILPWQLFGTVAMLVCCFAFGVSLSPPNLEGSPEMPKQLLHMSELLVTKMLDMPISEMKKFLKETLLTSTSTANRKEGEALLQSLEGLLENADGDLQIPNGDKSILETATVKGLQEALDVNGNVDENYLKDLKDVSDLKIIGDEMGWDFSDLTVERFHDILEEPLILERMVKDEDKKEQKSREKERVTRRATSIEKGLTTLMLVLA